MLTFYLVCKNGPHADFEADEEMDKIEVDCDYREGLRMMRCVFHVLKDFIKLSKLMGRTK